MLPTAGQREELPKIANCDDRDDHDDNGRGMSVEIPS